MTEELRDPNRAVRPCIKCGAADRNTNGQCKPCMARKSAEWRAANPDKATALRDKWAAENPEKVKAAKAKWRAANADKRKADRAARYAANPAVEKRKNAEWYAANRERVKAYGQQRHRQNPEMSRLKNHVRRARRQAVGGTLSKGLTLRLFKLQRGLCPCCGLPLGDDYHLDHVMPLALGGTNTDDNMQLLRSQCNHKKNAKHPTQYMQERGFLL